MIGAIGSSGNGKENCSRTSSLLLRMGLLPRPRTEKETLCPPTWFSIKRALSARLVTQSRFAPGGELP
jgi:hypothetical protein